MKIPMDSSLLTLYERMLDPNDRQSRTLRPNLRYSAIEKEPFDIIDALEIIHKKIGSHFCKLPSIKMALKQNTKADESLAECCVKGLDIQKINKRVDELNDPDKDLNQECSLLAEAEACGVNILLTQNGAFKQNFQYKANNVRILHPIDYAEEIRQ